MKYDRKVVVHLSVMFGSLLLGNLCIYFCTIFRAVFFKLWIATH